MPRRREVVKREAPPDPKFGDRQITHFTNVLLQRGKKSTAERIVYGALDLVEERLNEEPLKVFKRALKQLKAGLQSLNAGCADELQVSDGVLDDACGGAVFQRLTIFSQCRSK